MMFSVVLVFIATNTFYHIAQVFYGLKIIDKYDFMVLRPIYALLLTVNSSINLFFYLHFNKPFRTQFMKMFCKPKAKTEIEMKSVSHPDTNDSKSSKATGITELR